MSYIDIACLDILKLPHQLKTLIVDFEHRQIQSKHFFPQELKTLTLKTSVPFNTLSLPTKIKNITLWGPRQTLGDIHLPTSLENLTFGWDFSEDLDDLSLPNGLQSLSFGITFQSHLYKQHLFSNTIMSSSCKLNGSNLPAGLETLICGNRFNRTLSCFKMPLGLRILRFGDDFNQPLDNVQLPHGLQELSLAKVKAKRKPNRSARQLCPWKHLIHAVVPVLMKGCLELQSNCHSVIPACNPFKWSCLEWQCPLQASFKMKPPWSPSRCVWRILQGSFW